MKSKRIRLGAHLLALAVALVSADRLTADTLHVPSQYGTIQAAIDAAVSGDIVEIADGTYTGVGNRDLDLLGKAITVRSASGDPDSCIIDCEYEGRGFSIVNGPDPGSSLEGLTISRGFAAEGGGIYCANASPTITCCTIRDCAAIQGGGLYCVGSGAALISKCTFGNNRAFEGGGVGA
ncbi:MAG: right-handed parallel beta-helix repeat-containing protein, partial [Phycisphaerales bacterium JB038]